MPNNDDQLQRQYQEILNKYASSITPVTPSEPPTEIPVETPKVEAEPMVSKPIVVDKPTVPPIYFPPQTTPEKQSNFFKYLFYLSFLLFIGVVSAIIYNFVSNQQTPVEVNKVLPTSIPTKTVTQFCELGDKQIPVGESFPSADSCNTCSCTPNLTIVCTQKACVTPSVKPISGKIYKDLKYGYQFSCPTTNKYQVVATSVDGNTIPFKKETCISVDSVAYISVYDNTIVHSFTDIKTVVSPDKKYIITFEGDYVDIFPTFKFL